MGRAWCNTVRVGLIVIVLGVGLGVIKIRVRRSLIVLWVGMF